MIGICVFLLAIAGYASAITYGNPSTLDGAAYTVSLLLRDGTDPTGQTWIHRCNGAWMKFDLTTTIDSTTHNGYWVITSARCFDTYQQPIDWRAKLGARTDTDTSNVVTQGIRYILRHPTEDIAVVKLSSRPSEASPNRMRVEFPRRNSDAATNRSCTLSGGDLQTTTMKTCHWNNYQATAVGITNSWCNSQYYQTIDAADFPSDVICTTNQLGCNNCVDDGPFPSPCKSYDYGAPLACNFGSEYRLIGVGTAQDSSQSCGDAFAGVATPPMWTYVGTYWTWLANTINAN